MTRTDDGRLSAAAIGRIVPNAGAAPSATPPSSRREARELERRSERKTVTPRIRPARSMPTTVAPIASKATAKTRIASLAAARPKLASSRPKGRDAAARVTRSGGPLRTLMSMGAMLGVAAMLVSTSISGTSIGVGDPAEASAALEAGEILAAEVQSLGVVSATTTETDLVRDSYTAESYVPPVPVARFVSQSYGQTTANFSYTNNPAGSIQWPFALPAPISYGFGPRAACSYCSSYHLGVDFTPGAGVPIQAITEGVVSAVILDGGGLGNHVIIDHVVNGQRIQSVYAHMAWGSIQVATGQAVSVGTVIGAVGSTGASTGAHLHLEIHADGTPIDPFAWLKANAN
jgi:murein DD-endopeptidase MepM/ murein hydrolase activator NlpD